MGLFRPPLFHPMPAGMSCDGIRYERCCAAVSQVLYNLGPLYALPDLNALLRPGARSTTQTMPDDLITPLVCHAPLRPGIEIDEFRQNATRFDTMVSGAGLQRSGRAALALTYPPHSPTGAT